MILFGLHGVAAILQWLVDTILGPCEGYTLAYLDDILVYNRTGLGISALADRRVESKSPPKSKMGFTQLD